MPGTIPGLPLALLPTACHLASWREGHLRWFREGGARKRYRCEGPCPGGSKCCHLLTVF